MAFCKPLNPPLRDWRDKRVWLIGASTGIGAALAQQLLARGARVALSARSLAPLQALAEQSNTMGGDNPAWPLPLDITQPQQVQDAAQAIQKRWQGIDVVVVIAGTYHAMRADDFSLAKAEDVLAVNLHGPFNVLAAVLPILRAQQQGSLALVGSVAGYSGLPKALAYGPSKAALINLCESLYFDLHPLGIGVHLISPGFVDTPLTKGNDFKMPALISPEEAAQAMLDGFARGTFDIHFPKRFSLWLKLLRLLPYRWYFAAVSRMTGL